MDPLKELAHALDGAYLTETGPHTRDTAFMSVDFARAEELVSELAEHGVYLLERNLLSVHRYSAAAPIPDGLTPANTLQVRLEPPGRHAALGAAVAACNLDADIRALAELPASPSEAVTEVPEPLRELLVRTQSRPQRLSDLAGSLDGEARHLLIENLSHRGRHHGERAPFGQAPRIDPAIDTLATLLEDAIGGPHEYYNTGLYRTHAKTLVDQLELLEVAITVSAPRLSVPGRPRSTSETTHSHW